MPTPSTMIALNRLRNCFGIIGRYDIKKSGTSVRMQMSNYYLCLN